jgi:hypothetical protein
MTNEGTDQIARPMLPPDARALFSFLLAVANGRSSFDAEIDDLVEHLDHCTRARFCALVRKLSRANLLSVSAETWTITSADGFQPARLKPNVRFTIPNGIPRDYWT